MVDMRNVLAGLKINTMARTWLAYVAQTCCCLGLLSSGSIARAQSGAPLVERVWYDGDRVQRIWMAPDEVAVTFDTRAMPQTPAAAERSVRLLEPSAVLQKQTGPVSYFKLDDGHTPQEHALALRRNPDVRHVSPVFYTNTDRTPDTRMALTGQIIVGFRAPLSQPDLQRFAREHDVSLFKSLDISPTTYVFNTPPGTDSLELANRIHLSGQVAFAYPNWIKSVVAR